MFFLSIYPQQFGNWVILAGCVHLDIITSITNCNLIPNSDINISFQEYMTHVVSGWFGFKAGQYYNIIFLQLYE